MFAILATLLLAVAPALAAVTVTVGEGSAWAEETIQIPIIVDDPAGIAGAAFTVLYDNSSINLSHVQSDFFDTFDNQWAALDPQPDPYPAGNVEVDGGIYTQPLIENLVSEIGSRIAAARCTGQTNPEKTARDVSIACFGLTFKPDIDDLRESPALQIVTQVANEHRGPIFVVEPNIDVLPQAVSELVSLMDSDVALLEADIVLILVNHKVFASVIESISRDKYKVIDTRGI